MRNISSINGQDLWSKTTLGAAPLSCATCHGSKPDTNMAKIWNAVGTASDHGNPVSIRKGIVANSGGMGSFAAVSDADLADIAAYVNATKWGLALNDGSGIARILPFDLWQNGGKVITDPALPEITLPTVLFGSAPTVKTLLTFRAPLTASLSIGKIALDNSLFTLSMAPAPVSNRQLKSALAASDAPTLAPSTDLACKAPPFVLLPGEACGVEVVLAINSPGEFKANLAITANALSPEIIPIVATVGAQATGGEGGGGCTMRSTPSLFDPVLLLLSLLSFGILGVRRLKKAKV
jgi:hypothetical protein